MGEGADRDGRGGGGTVQRRDGCVSVLPVLGLEAQVHPLRLSVLEADAGFAVEVLQGRQDFINLVLVCSGGGEGVSVRTKTGTSPTPP